MCINSCISIKNATKCFGGLQVLNEIQVEFQQGLIHGLVGRNGSGKTMLMKCICGFIPLTSGEITVFGKKIGEEIDFPENTGIIIESPGFLPNYSGFKNLQFLAGIRQVIKKEHICEMMQLVGLDPDSKKHVGKYSMGMRQRLGLAQALMENPQLLLLDEPMNGLDNQGVDEIRKVLQSLREQGKTILLASHNREDIDQLCDTVHMMDNGVMTIAV